MAGIEAEDFFKKKRETSEIKSEIFIKYFKFWCGILLHGQKYKQINEVIYIDLFSGPGYYEDQEPSTPIKILNSIFKTNGQKIDLNISVKTFFNDSNSGLIAQLEKNINELEYYPNLVHKPVLLNKVASRTLLTSLLKKNVPSLTFIDPFGYTFSMQMLLDSVREWGSDLFMLFNLNRIRAAIMNPTVEKLMNEIFQNELNEIRDYYLKETNPHKREDYILDKFEKLFRDKGYFLFKFKINFLEKNSTSHYLILVTKVKIAYNSMKDIMSKYSDYQPDGVPLFATNTISTPLFFDDLATYSILKLKDDLIKNSNRYNYMVLEDIFLEHSINTNYIKVNYKSAIELLLNETKIKIENPKGEIAKKITYTCKIIFI
jgi:three-Cys-motif partner protein